MYSTIGDRHARIGVADRLTKDRDERKKFYIEPTSDMRGFKVSFVPDGSGNRRYWKAISVRDKPLKPKCHKLGSIDDKAEADQFKIACKQSDDDAMTFSFFSSDNNKSTGARVYSKLRPGGDQGEKGKRDIVLQQIEEGESIDEGEFRCVF